MRPAKSLLRLCGVTHERIDLRRSEIAGVYSDKSAPGKFIDTNFIYAATTPFNRPTNGLERTLQ